MERRARIGVVGAGWWATTAHIPALLANQRAELAAMCDADAERLAAAAGAFGIERTYTDLAAMLEQERLDGAIVVTSHASHYPLARLCLERGLHLVVEKPLTLSAADARDLVRLAAAQERQLIVGYPYSYSRHALRAREVLASGDLGPIQLVSCVFNSNCIDLLRGVDQSAHTPSAYKVHGPGAVYSQPHLSGGGHGHLQLTHPVGLLSFVTGLRPASVTAAMRNHGLAVDLVDAISVVFAGEALGTVAGTSNGFVGKFDLQIACEHGFVDMDMAANLTRIHRRDGPTEELGADETIYQLDAPANNLVACILDGAANGSPAEPGWRTVELLDAAYRSAAQGGAPVAIMALYP